MRAASDALKNLLVGNQYLMADLYTITLQSGAVYRYTSYDQTLIYEGNTYLANDVMMERSNLKFQVGVQVDTLEVIAYANLYNLIDGTPFLQFVHNGGLDNARIALDRMFFSPVIDGTAPTTSSAGVVRMFEGRVADIEVTRTKATISVNSDVELLNIKMPKNLYQSSCMHNLYDTGCTLLKADFAINSTVSALGSTLNSITASSLTQASGWFNNGFLIFTSGPNEGVRKTVNAFASGVLTFSRPLAAQCNIGDTFVIYPGCDKTQTTCTTKFSNVIHFRGYPYIPVPETAT